jgi:AmmeMemoRadiSam system protein B
MKRSPAVAGQFYSGTPDGLNKEVERYITAGVQKEKAIAVMSPHAGLIYSGHVAGAVYSSIIFPKTFILIGPNHTGLGSRAAIMSSGQWAMPSGSFQIDGELAKAVLSHTGIVQEDSQAHMFEHSLEVQLPFIGYFSDSVKIVPITVMSASVDECAEIGEAVASAIKQSGYDIVIAASTDMSHYVPDETARKLDALALKEALNLNPEGLYNTVMRNRISMCGVIPSTIMLFAANALGATEARLVKYATSGEISGDYERVVGYAGVVIK